MLIGGVVTGCLDNKIRAFNDQVKIFFRILFSNLFNFPEFS